MKMIQTLLIGLTIVSGDVLNATLSGIPFNQRNVGNTPRTPLNTATPWAQFCYHRTVLEATRLLQSQGRPVTSENVIAVQDQAIAQVKSIPRDILEQQFIQWATDKRSSFMSIIGLFEEDCHE